MERYGEGGGGGGGGGGGAGPPPPPPPPPPSWCAWWVGYQTVAGVVPGATLPVVWWLVLVESTVHRYPSAPSNEKA